MKLLTMIVFSILLATTSLFAQDDVYEACDKMPEIKGGLSELAKNVVYPEEAHKEGIEGKVIVEAVIDESGDVESSKVLKSDNAKLDEAALLAVNNTKFIPGKHEEKVVKVKAVIPIMFRLQDCEKDE